MKQKSTKSKIIKERKALPQGEPESILLYERNWCNHNVHSIWIFIVLSVCQEMKNDGDSAM